MLAKNPEKNSIAQVVSIYTEGRKLSKANIIVTSANILREHTREMVIK
jgi:hypothetical protein